MVLRFPLLAPIARSHARSLKLRETDFHARKTVNKPGASNPDCHSPMGRLRPDLALHTRNPPNYGMMTRMTRIALLTTVVATLLLAGCASQPRQASPARSTGASTPANIRSAVSAIDHHLSRYRKVVGHWKNEQTASTYQAYFNRSMLKYVVETAGGERDQGYAVNKYYFRDGELFYFRGQGSAGDGDVMNPRPAEIDIQLAFNRRGDVTQSAKAVNGRAAKLEPDEVAAIRQHARELRREARSLGGGNK